MFREIPEYSMFSRFVATLVDHSRYHCSLNTYEILAIKADTNIKQGSCMRVEYL